jgi:hypothetical protein
MYIIVNDRRSRSSNHNRSDRRSRSRDRSSNHNRSFIKQDTGNKQSRLKDNNFSLLFVLFK